MRSHPNSAKLRQGSLASIIQVLSPGIFLVIVALVAILIKSQTTGLDLLWTIFMFSLIDLVDGSIAGGLIFIGNRTRNNENAIQALGCLAKGLGILVFILALIFSTWGVAMLE